MPALGGRAIWSGEAESLLGRKTDIGRIQNEPGMISGGIRDDETECQESVETKTAVRPEASHAGRKPMGT